MPYTRTFTLAAPSSPVAYTTPIGKVALVKSLLLANTTSGPAEVTVTVTPLGGTPYKLIQSGVIPKGASLNAIDAVLVLISGDALAVHTPGASGDVHATLSLMEVTQ